MFKVNDNFTKLPASYLFSQVAAKISAFMAENPGVEVIRMGIGDVTRPICQAAVDAMHKAVDDERHSTATGLNRDMRFSATRLPNMTITVGA